MISLKDRFINTTKNNTANVLLASRIEDLRNYLSVADFSFVREKAKSKKLQVIVPDKEKCTIVQLIKNDGDKDTCLEQLRKDANNLHTYFNEQKITDVYIVDTEKNTAETLAFADGLALGSYRFVKYLKKQEEKRCTVRKIYICSKHIVKAAIEELNNVHAAVFKARDLVNEPVNMLNAVSLAEEIASFCRPAGCRVSVFDKKKIQSLRMGGLLAVNKGSLDPPTFTIVEWQPRNARNKKPVVLVGKGLVFDTGGLSLKPTPDSMEHMKSDMSGGAAVACTMYAVAKNKLPVHVVALIPATDNRPDGNAYAPGDIVRMFDGTTVEVLNTDAEGRMILADALSFAKKYNPALVFSIATLTGSAAMAIGKYGIVAMGNVEKKMMDTLKNSGDKVHERIVEFPFWDDYAELLKSDIADLQNIGGKYAGAITAGKFLEHFTDYPFIHLDIAGPAFVRDHDSYRGKGATGVGVRLLYDFLKNL